MRTPLWQEPACQRGVLRMLHGSKRRQDEPIRQALNNRFTMNILFVHPMTPAIKIIIATADRAAVNEWEATGVTRPGGVSVTHLACSLAFVAAPADNVSLPIISTVGLRTYKRNDEANAASFLSISLFIFMNFTVKQRLPIFSLIHRRCCPPHPLTKRQSCWQLLSVS